MGVRAKNKEDYITFSISVEVDKYVDKNGEERSKEIELRFIDSCKFMSSSLDSLVNNLARGNNKFFGFEDYNESQHKLLIRKGIYPYEYMDDWNRFKETAFHPKEAFYSKLNMSGVGDQDYEHARRVWSKFGIHNLGEYHDARTLSCWQTSSKHLGRSVWITTDWIQLTSIQFGTNNTQNVANLGDNWRKIR